MLLQIDSKQEVKWATVLFTPDIDDILYCSVFLHAFGYEINSLQTADQYSCFFPICISLIGVRIEILLYIFILRPVKQITKCKSLTIIC